MNKKRALWSLTTVVVVALLVSGYWLMQPPPSEDPAVVDFAPPVMTSETRGGVKVFALHLGDTTVPYGQFFGGIGEEWVGWKGVWKFFTEKSTYITVPVYAFLIDHPQAGPILVDAGINRDMAHAHDQYYSHPLLQWTTDEDEYQLTQEQELTTQLAQLGYSPEDIKTVILTHLHEDHLGELRSFPQANVYLTAAEWNAMNLGIFSFRKWSPSFAGVVKTVSFVPFSSGPFQNFEQSQDLLGDGSVVLLPTPGHADGHMAVLVQMEGYQLMLAGDTLYTLRHLAGDQVRAISLGEEQQAHQIASNEQIVQLWKANPALIIIPAHDPTAYLSSYLSPALVDGNLSLQEQQQLKAYEAQLFDPSGRLAEGALPRFIAAEDGGTVGTVSEP